MNTIDIDLYPGSGYFNAAEVMTLPFPQIFVTGGRGIGKTFSCVLWLVQNRIPFIYLRRIDKDAYISRMPDSSDVGKVLRYLGEDFYVEKVPKTSFGYFRRSSDDSIICYIAANKTFENVRGADFSWCKWIVYDEFIPKPSEMRFREEGQGLYHIMETVGRNRELEGEEPLRLICLSNALNMQNDVFLEFELLDMAEALIMDDRHEAAYDERNRLMIVCKYSPISEAKLQTSLYQSASSSFVDMAIRNKFIYDDMSYVINRNLKEYTAVCAVGPLYIYKHKSRAEWYCCFSRSNTKNVFTTQSTGIEEFRRKYWKMNVRFLDGKIKFQNYRAQTLFERFIGRI